MTPHGSSHGFRTHAPLDLLPINPGHYRRGPVEAWVLSQFRQDDDALITYPPQEIRPYEQGLLTIGFP